MRRDKVALALALAAVAGFIDAVGYITLRHLFTAHMSGNSARLGVHLGHLDLRQTQPLAVAVGLFIFGIALATVLLELAARRGVRSITALLLGLQALMLATFMVYGTSVIGQGYSVADHGPRDFYVLAALAILSIGFQACALQRVAGQTTRTTYISGMLTKATQEAVNWLFWLHDGERRDRSSYLSEIGYGSRRESLVRALLFGGIWCLYIAGAVLGSYTDSLWRLWSLACPLAVLAIAIIADLWRPFHP